MSFEIISDPPREGSSESAMLEPTTRILHNGRECGVIVQDDNDGRYDIWIAVQDPEQLIGWRWLHRTTRPATLIEANRIVQEAYTHLSDIHRFHYFP